MIETERILLEGAHLGMGRRQTSGTIHARIAAAGKEVPIPLRCNRRWPATYDKKKYQQHNKVERLFNKLKPTVR